MNGQWIGKAEGSNEGQNYMGITAGSLFPGLDGACEELKERFRCWHTATIFPARADARPTEYAAPDGAFDFVDCRSANIPRRRRFLRSAAVSKNSRRCWRTATSTSSHEIFSTTSTIHALRLVLWA
jgi:hypothetical protein